MEPGLVVPDATMTIVLTVCIVVAAVIGILGLLARGQTAAIRSLRDIESHIVPVDVAALVNLFDPRQDQYLRDRLTRRQYARVRWERNLVGTEYVGRIASNAAVLLRANYFARLHASDEATRVAAGETMNLAIRTRTAALSTLVTLYLRIIFPSWGDPVELGRRYENVLNRTVSAYGQGNFAVSA
jgi:hypothetical protein